METTKQNASSIDATNKGNSLDYSKAEIEMKNIAIPGSVFRGRWKKDEGYSIGYENVRLTKDYETLEKALNTIGYGVEKDKEGDEILVKVGEIDFEMIVRIIRAVNMIEAENMVKELEGRTENV